jgi:uncharacterized protein involved in outer membrane biogenesis
MRSLMKKVFLACLVFLLVIGIGVFIALNTLVHKGIETIGSDITKTDVDIESVRIRLLLGHAEMSRLVIGNPKGYSTPYALSCEKIAIDFDPHSVFLDTLIIQQILIDEPSVMYEASMKGSNINALSRTIDSYGRDGGPANVKDKQEKQGSAVIKKLLIKKGQIHVNAALTVALPEIEMQDIGREGQGMQSSHIVTMVFGAISSTVLTTVSSGKPLMEDVSRTVGNVLSQGVKTGGASVEKVLGGIKGILGSDK